MIIPRNIDVQLDHSAHRALWSLLPAPAQRALAWARPLGALDAPRPAGRGASMIAGLMLLALAATQQWVWLALLAAALAGASASQRVLAGRTSGLAAARARDAQRVAAEARRVKQNQIASTEALAIRSRIFAMTVIIIMIITVVAQQIVSSITQGKTKSVDHNLTNRIFGQQLAGAAT